jgi:hypothetical protein
MTEKPTEDTSVSDRFASGMGKQSSHVKSESSSHGQEWLLCFRLRIVLLVPLVLDAFMA